MQQVKERKITASSDRKSEKKACLIPVFQTLCAKKQTEEIIRKLKADNTTNNLHSNRYGDDSNNQIDWNFQSNKELLDSLRRLSMDRFNRINRFYLHLNKLIQAA